MLYDLKYMRVFADAWGRHEIVQALLAQLSWYHLTLLEQLKSRGDRIAYAGVSTYQLGLPPLEQLQEKLQKVFTSSKKKGRS